MFLPSGRMHAIGAGLVIVEIQQNSDTTYRVFDWNRTDENGQPRGLHVDESMRSIDFEDYEPALVTPDGETLVRHPLFSVHKWPLSEARPAAPAGTFAIVVCLSGEAACAGVSLRPGQFLLVPASLTTRTIEPQANETTVLRITAGET
jgi:mannose-6-phosphate isomerase